MKSISQLIIDGEKNNFYKLAVYGWESLRESRLDIDNHECMMCNGRWSDGIHKPLKIQLKRAQAVHHIKSLELYPELAQDIKNLISLCNTCHNIVEGRYKKWAFKEKKFISEEKW